MGLCLLAGGIANAKYAEDNADLVEDNETRCNLGLLSSDTCADLERVKNFEITSAVSHHITNIMHLHTGLIIGLTFISFPEWFKPSVFTLNMYCVLVCMHSALAQNPKLTATTIYCTK